MLSSALTNMRQLMLSSALTNVRQLMLSSALTNVRQLMLSSALTNVRQLMLSSALTNVRQLMLSSALTNMRQLMLSSALTNVSAQQIEELVRSSRQGCGRGHKRNFYTIVCRVSVNVCIEARAGDPYNSTARAPPHSIIRASVSTQASHSRQRADHTPQGRRDHTRR